MGVPESLLLVLLSIAVCTDLLSRKIPNALVALGLCLGLGVSNAVAGLDGALSSVLGALAGLAAFLPFYVLRWMGAGDVKLLSMVGSFVGVPSIFPVAFYAAIAGGALGLCSQFLVRLGWLTIRGAPEAGPQRSMRVGKISSRFWQWRSQTSFQLPYAVAIFIGTAAWLITRGV